MSVEAAKIAYREAFVAEFEQRVSDLRYSTTKETMSSGNQVTFLVAGTAGDTAVTRGVNGQIPYGKPNNTQVAATLVEKHAPYELTGFNIFSSQGDQMAIMRQGSMSVINRDIDLTILAALASATIDTGAVKPADLFMVQSAKAELGNNDVDIADENNMFAAITPAFAAYLEMTTEYSSADYVEYKTFTGGMRKMRRWSGINWMVSTAITGLGTNTELCYMWHRNAIGYSVNVGEEKIAVGYDEKQDSSYSRATIYHVAKVLQNSGIVQMKHDGSAFNLS